MEKPSLVKVAILVGPKGRGSNMAALINAGRNQVFPGEIECVIAPKADSPALEVAKELGVRTVVVEYGDRFESGLVEAVRDCQWLCLAGFLRVVPSGVLQYLEGRVLNIHPSLLPKHGGKGMYGHFVHEAVIAAGDRESGCTVHYVNEVYDDGAPLMQASCPVEPDDTAETLAARVLKLEHLTYALALKKAIHERAV